MDNNLASIFPANSFFNRFFAEKNLEPQIYEIDVDGTLHMVETGAVLEHIALTQGEERLHIEAIIRKIDFYNGDLHHFFRHLAEYLAKSHQRIVGHGVA